MEVPVRFVRYKTWFNSLGYAYRDDVVFAAMRAPEVSASSVIRVGVETSLVVLPALPAEVFNLGGNADKHGWTPIPALKFLASYAHFTYPWHLCTPS